MLARLDKAGRVVIREQSRRIVSAGLLKPSAVAEKLQERLPLKIGVHHVVRAWQKLGCRPLPDQIILSGRMKYCIYDEPHKDYLFTQAFVDKVARELSTAEKFETFTGLKPVREGSEVQ